jgi:hypothetical protein
MKPDNNATIVPDDFSAEQVEKDQKSPGPLLANDFCL